MLISHEFLCTPINNFQIGIILPRFDLHRHSKLEKKWVKYWKLEIFERVFKTV